MNDNLSTNELYLSLGQVTYQLELYSAMIKNLEDQKNQLLQEINKSENNIEPLEENDNTYKQ